MKTRYVVLFTLFGIVLIISSIVIGFKIARSISMPDYEFLTGFRMFDSSIVIEDETYIYIYNEEYEIINDKLTQNDKEQLFDINLLTIKYSTEADTYKVDIFSNKDKENRILLQESDHGFFSEFKNIYRYYCRFDEYLEDIDLEKIESNNDSILYNQFRYKKVDEVTFRILEKEIMDQNIWILTGQKIGVMKDYVDGQWSTIVYGSQEDGNFIIFGKERYAYYDKKYPNLYYCREDIYDLYNEYGSLKNVDLHEYVDR